MKFTHYCRHRLIMNGNRLAAETSLYLRQHARNPVDWYPWGPEALQAARDQQKPIFLSVGYSACHWCHVMEHECFENPTIAKLMNEGFICIKVDREERPDLDQLYMNAHHVLNRGEGGGWPLSVFLTPELLPFYAGTYFPPDNRYEPHRPSFPRLLNAISQAWKTRRDELSELGQNIAGYLATLGESESSDKPLSLEILQEAWTKLKRIYDPVHGGFGNAPKFPHPMELKVLLRLHHRFADPEALTMVRQTLEKMARGGIYDQIGGGFHRYSVDAYWLVPHFEKMLYDNALLPPVYLEAWQLTREPFYRQITCETLDYVLREMTSSSGAFYSTQDADSEGEEGKFYVWSLQELEDVLGPELAETASRIFGVNELGNFEGHNILHRTRSDEQEANRLGMSQTEYSSMLVSIKQKLHARRAQRVWPGRDEKILTAWNGLMITAFARAGTVFNKPDYIQAAQRAAEFIHARLRTPSGRLLRTCGEATTAKIPAFLEDYAYLAEGLMHLWEATFELSWLTWASELADMMIQHFSVPSGGFYYTADDAEPLITRSKDHQDGSTPSGNAVAVLVLTKLATLTGGEQYRRVAERTLQLASEAMRDNPVASGQLLISLDYFLGPTSEVVVVGPRSSPEVESMLQHYRQQFHPRRIVIWTDGMESHIPVANGKQFIPPVTTYLCEKNTCLPPIVGVDAIIKS